MVMRGTVHHWNAGLINHHGNTTASPWQYNCITMAIQLYHHGNTIASQWQQAKTCVLYESCRVHATFKLLVTGHAMTPACGKAGLWNSCLNLCVHFGALSQEGLLSAVCFHLHHPTPVAHLYPHLFEGHPCLDTNGEMMTITKEVTPYTGQCCLKQKPHVCIVCKPNLTDM